MKMTFQPKKRQRAKVHGFRQRMKTAGGRKVIFSSFLIVFRRTASNEIFRFVEKKQGFSECI